MQQKGKIESSPFDAQRQGGEFEKFPVCCRIFGGKMLCQTGKMDNIRSNLSKVRGKSDQKIQVGRKFDR